jgi:hypothetical protein
MAPESILVNALIYLIDSLEESHCEKAARCWRIRHKKEGIAFPDKYKDYL